MTGQANDATLNEHCPRCNRLLIAEEDQFGPRLYCIMGCYQQDLLQSQSEALVMIHEDGYRGGSWSLTRTLRDKMDGMAKRKRQYNNGWRKHNWVDATRQE